MKITPRLAMLAGGILTVLAVGILSRVLERPERAFSRALTKAVHSPVASVSLGALSTQPWQRVHIFGPFTDSARITTALGFPWSGKALGTIAKSDGVNLLLFVNDQQVVMSVLHPRNQGDFALDGTNLSVTKADATFVIERRTRDHWIELRHARGTTPTNRP